MSPALAGGFLTTAPPGKSHKNVNYNRIEDWISLSNQAVSVLGGAMEGSVIASASDTPK